MITDPKEASRMIRQFCADKNIQLPMFFIIFPRVDDTKTPAEVASNARESHGIQALGALVEALGESPLGVEKMEKSH